MAGGHEVFVIKAEYTSAGSNRIADPVDSYRVTALDRTAGVHVPGDVQPAVRSRRADADVSGVVDKDCVHRGAVGGVEGVAVS